MLVLSFPFGRGKNEPQDDEITFQKNTVNGRTGTRSLGRLGLGQSSSPLPNAGLWAPKR